MMRFYNVGNSNRRGMYIVAPNEEAAKEYSLHRGHVLDKKNATVTDLTEHYAEGGEDIEHLLEQDRVGQAVKRVKAFDGKEFAAMLRGEGDPERHQNNDQYGWRLTNEISPEDLLGDE